MDILSVGFEFTVKILAGILGYGMASAAIMYITIKTM